MTAKPLTFLLIGICFAVASVVTAAAGRAGASYPGGSAGYDVSYPQCPSNFPNGGAFGIVGVTNGLPWSANPCLADEYTWAAGRSSPPAFYANTANPGPISTHWGLPGPRQCTDASSYDDTGCSYNYGWNAAAQAFTAAASATSPSAPAVADWWLDVETANSWNGSAAANTATIEGYIDYLAGQRAPSTGIYSNAFDWNAITGGASLAVPNWLAGSGPLSGAPAYCGATFAGGPVLLVQYRAGQFDGDYACGASGTATPTSTWTTSATRTATATRTASATSTLTPSATRTSSETATPTNTRAVTLTPSPTASFTSTPTINPALDSDGDGCPDARELGPDWHTGGQRDPMNPWDFYDVPVPVLLPGHAAGSRSRFVNIADVIAILAYVGTTASNPDAANANGATYGSDLNGNGVADGVEYDRSASNDKQQPWRSGAPSGFVSLASVLVALSQVGTDCT